MRVRCVERGLDHLIRRTPARPHGHATRGGLTRADARASYNRLERPGQRRVEGGSSTHERSKDGGIALGVSLRMGWEACT